MGNFKKDFIARRSSCFKKEEGGGKTQEEIRKLPSDRKTSKGNAYDAALAKCKAKGGCEDGLLNGVSREEYINA